MANFDLKSNMVYIVIGALFLMSVLPGQGTKAADQQAIVSTGYICNLDSDCPKCMGAGISDYNPVNTTFLQELSYGVCDSATHRCQLSDACLIWECPSTSGGQQLTNGTIVPCKSVRQTIMDNTIVKMNQNPMIFIAIIGIIIALILL